MLNVQMVPVADGSGTLVLPVDAAGLAADAPAEVRAEAAELLRTAEDAARAGAVQVVPRPLRRPDRLVLVGVGDGDDAAWRTAGAAVARAVPDAPAIRFALPAGLATARVRAVAEGLALADYRYRGPDAPDSRAATDSRGKSSAPERTVELIGDPRRHSQALERAHATAVATRLARDLTNAPASQKSPAWLADRMVAEAHARAGVSVDVREPDRLATEGFGGILAVGEGSVRGPRLVELTWAPADARRHVVLVGKGVTFDTGGISIKPREAMKLMRKDMGGAAAVAAATFAAADLGLPVRITTLAPLAENMPSGSALRPGDVLRHYDGTTSESTNSDAEGRLLVADALGYAVRELRPDVLVDLATLTGANAVALGKRTAALYSPSDVLAAALTEAATDAGERVWRMPLPEEYREYLRSDIADLYSAPDRCAGSVVAALYLREFVGELADRWAHVDMSAPSWADADVAELSAGATGWGVRTLVRWLEGVAGVPPLA